MTTPCILVNAVFRSRPYSFSVARNYAAARTRHSGKVGKDRWSAIRAGKRRNTASGRVGHFSAKFGLPFHPSTLLVVCAHLVGVRDHLSLICGGPPKSICKILRPPRCDRASSAAKSSGMNTLATDYVHVARHHLLRHSRALRSSSCPLADLMLPQVRQELRLCTRKLSLKKAYSCAATRPICCWLPNLKRAGVASAQDRAKTRQQRVPFAHPSWVADVRPTPDNFPLSKESLHRNSANPLGTAQARTDQAFTNSLDAW